MISSFNIITAVSLRMLHGLNLKAAVVLYAGFLQEKISLDDFKTVANKLHIEPYLKDLHDLLKR